MAQRDVIFYKNTFRVGATMGETAVHLFDARAQSCWSANTDNAAYAAHG